MTRWLLMMLCCTLFAASPAARGASFEPTIQQQLQAAEDARASGDLKAAQQRLDQVFVALEAHPDEPVLRAEAHNIQGAVLLTGGELREAQQHLQQALDLLTAADDLAGRLALQVRNNLGYALRDRGDLRGAHAQLSEAALLAPELGQDVLTQAVILHNLAQVDYARGDLAVARERFQASLKLSQAEGGSELMAGSSLLALAVTEQRLGAEQTAQSLESQAEAIFARQPESCHCTAFPLFDLGNAALRRGDLKTAASRLRSAYREQQALTPDSLLVAMILRGQAAVALLAAELRDAEQWAGRALAIEKQTDQTSLSLAASEYLSGRVASALDQPRQARTHYCAATASLDKVQLPFAADPLAQARFHSQYIDVYLSCVRAQLDAGMNAAAFASWERARARGYLEALWQRDLQLPAELQQRLPQPQQIGSGQAIAARLPAGTLLLSFAVAESEVIVFAVQQSTIEVHRLRLSQARLSRQIKQLRALIERRNETDLELIRSQSGQLFEQLLGPLRTQLASADHLLIAPDDALHELPFAALWDTQEKRWLIEQLPLSLIESVANRQQLAGRNLPPRPARLLAVADPYRPLATPSDDAQRGELAGLPALPAARDEVRAVRRSFVGAADLLVGAPATRAKVKQLAGAASVLHFAVHALFAEQAPLDSALVLAADPQHPDDSGLLEAWDIFENWRLQARLVVLSACETGLGGDYGGEGVLGLARAFQFAGAQSVLATLWRIEDGPTARLMQAFYAAQAKSEGLDQALRTAVLAHLSAANAASEAAAERGVGGLQTDRAAQKPRHDGRHPYEWAAFVLHGQ